MEKGLVAYRDTCSARSGALRPCRVRDDRDAIRVTGTFPQRPERIGTANEPAKERGASHRYRSSPEANCHALIRSADQHFGGDAQPGVKAADHSQRQGPLMV